MLLAMTQPLDPTLDEVAKRRRRIRNRIYLFTSLGVFLLLFITYGSHYARESRRLTANREMLEIRTALERYFTENQRWPGFQTRAAGTGDWQTETGFVLITPMMGGSPYLTINPRAHSEASPGLFQDAKLGSALRDPWGNPYQVVIDTNNDRVVNVPKRSGEPGLDKIYKRVAIWSLGPDGKLGRGEKAEADDLFLYK